MLETLIVLAIAGLSFYSGMKVSDKYNQNEIDNAMYLLRVNTASRVPGYIPPYQREKREHWLGREFSERLRSTGKAIQVLRK